jgi:hypothetical protein
MVIEKTHLGVGTHSAGGSILTVSWCPTDSCLENDTILEEDGKENRDYNAGVAVKLQVLCVWPSQACTVERVKAERLKRMSVFVA